MNGSINWKTKLDYDGFDWGNYPYAFKWGNNVRLPDIAAFQALTGQELHAIQIAVLKILMCQIHRQPQYHSSI